MTNTEHLNRLYEAIKQLQDILKKDKAEELSQLEIDLSLDKLKQMYDVLLKLRAAPVFETDSELIETEELIKEPLPVVDFVMDIDESIQEMESPIHEIETEEILTSEPELEPEPEPKMEAEVLQEPDIKNEKEIEPESEVEKEVVLEIETEIEEEVVSEPEVEKEVIMKAETETEEEIRVGDVLDLFNEKQETEENIPTAEKNDILSEQETVADWLLKDKLESIKSAIGINEKFFFLNELFNGDLQTYNDNIEKLDSQNSLEEALSFLNELSEQFGWNTESEALEQITQMLNNKFS